MKDSGRTPSPEPTNDVVTTTDSPRYRRLQICGAGGFGVVWRVQDHKLGREIAIKQLAERLAGDEEARQRFLQEARLTARLEHPGIVPIYDVGSDTDPVPHYAMKLVHGRTLAEAIAQYHARRLTKGERTVQLLQLLSSFLAVARTMEFAHARGVIHRDLKPQNIVLGEFGETVILDWGLAKERDPRTPHAPDEGNELLSSGSPMAKGDQREPGFPAKTAGTSPLASSAPINRSLDHLAERVEYGKNASTVTQPGTVKGTPAYMAPEQAAGQVDQIDQQTDVYALGVILYELLTGHLPFEGQTADDVQQMVLDHDPIPPRVRDGRIPRPLEAVCLKAMARLPAGRYSDVRLLCQDLERALADEPVSVCPEVLWERVARWTRRHRAATLAIASTSAALAIILAVALAVVTGARGRETAARREADVQRDEARRQAALAEQRLQQTLRETYNLELVRVRDLWQSEPGRAMAILEDTRRCPIPFRDFAWGFYHRLADCLRWSATTPGAFVSAVAISADGRTLAVGGEAAEIRLLDPQTGRETGQLQGHTGWIIDLAFSPDGQTLFSAGADKTVRQWAVGTAKLTRTLAAHDDHVNAVAVSPEGARVLSGGADGQVKIWSVSDGRPLRQVVAHEGEVLDLVWLEEQLAATAGEDGLVRLWNGDLQPTQDLIGHEAPVEALASLGDQKLASGSHDGTIIVWDVVRAVPSRRWVGHDDRVYGLASSPRGEIVASAGWDRTVRLWDLASDKPRTTFSGHAASVLSVCLSSEPLSLFSGDNAGRVYAWNAAPSTLKTAIQEQAAVLSLAFLPARRQVVAAGGDRLFLKPGGFLHIWNLETQPPHSPPGVGSLPQPITSVTVAQNGQWLAAASSDGVVRAGRIGERGDLRRLGEHTGYVMSVAFSPDGSRLASAGGDRLVKLWEVASGKLLGSWEAHSSNVQCLAFGPRGDTLASAGWDRTVAVWCVPNGQLITRLNHSAAGSAWVAYSANESLIAPLSDDSFGCYQIPSGKLLREFRGHAARVNALSVSADRKTVASADQRGSIRLWDPERGQERAEWSAHEAPILALQFAADSRELASADEQGNIRIWNAQWENSHAKPQNRGG